MEAINGNTGIRKSPWIYVILSVLYLSKNSLIVKINIATVTTLPREIYRFNTIPMDTPRYFSQN